MIYKAKLKSEKGNALFLILIAVALFAALSYAVTQSGSGGGTIDREQSLISASQLTQYPALVRTTVTRMVLTGVAVSNLSFDSTPVGTSDREVFGAQGGAVGYQVPPSSSGATDWGFTHDVGGNGYYITGVGTDTATGEDVIMYADGISQNVCEQVRKGLGLATTPTVEATAVVYPVYDYSTIPPTITSGGGAAAGNNAYSFNSDAGEAYSCVQNAAGGNYVYYHALVEQ